MALPEMNDPRHVMKASTKEKWEQIRNDPYYAKTRECALRNAEKFMNTDPPRILFSEIHLYNETGDRAVFERVYSEYEVRMKTLRFCYYLTGDEKYIEPLANIIWNICDFESWSIPAHVLENLPEEIRKINLDLTSTILAYELAEVLYFMGDKLPALVEKRLRYEIQTRLIDSYKNHTWNWETRTNNWSAVCIAAVLGAYLFVATDEEIKEQLPRMKSAIDCYLQGFKDDGACTEGYAYWVYGFEFFMIFAAMLRDYTNGEDDLFRNPKVHEIALFQQNMALTETEGISFADGDDTFRPAAWISHFLKHEYPDVEIPDIPPEVYAGPMLPSVLWQDPALATGQKMNPKSHIYPDSQWYIYRGKYNFACKAGYNNEPHNHNDIGSFIIAKNGKVTFTDPGKNQYTRQYFSPERYDYLVTSGRGHSVPIINGVWQSQGSRISTVTIARDGEYEYTIDNGYNGIPSLKSIVRHFVCSEDEISLTDTFEFTEAPESVIERFVSLHEPVLGDGTVRVLDSTLRYDPAIFDASVTSEQVTRPGGRVDTVWLTDLTMKKTEEKKFTLSFRFD